MKLKKVAANTDLEGILFPVELRDEEMWANSEYAKKVVAIIDGREKLINQCSKQYNLIPNSEIFPKIEEILKQNKIKFTPSYSELNHARFYADLQITDENYLYKMENTNDLIQPMLRIQHSYNGLTEFKIMFGYFRLVCTNGLTVPVAEMKEFNLSVQGKHTNNASEILKKFEATLIYFVQNAQKITNKILESYEILGGKWIENPKDRITEVLAATDIKMVENSKRNTLDDIYLRIMEESNNQMLGYDGKVNDWLIYNGINQYINDNDINSMVPEKRQKKDLEVFEFLLHS